MNPFALRLLYGFDEGPPPKVVDAYVHLLVHVARSGGFVESETSLLFGMAEALGALPFAVSRAIEEKDVISPTAALAQIPAGSPLRRTLYRDAVLIARSDGKRSHDEDERIMRIAVKLGLRPEEIASAKDQVTVLDAFVQGLRGSRSLA